MRTLALSTIPLTMLLVVAACSDDDTSSSAPTGDAGDPRSEADAGASATGSAVTLSFEARVGDAPFSCSTPATGMGTTGATLEPLDFRIYVHDVRLVDERGAEVPVTLADDGKWQHQGVALLDFEDRSGTCVNGTSEVNTSLRGAAPAGTYTGLKLKVGVPFAMNHADVATAPSPLNLSGLFWGWNAGYKFARIDGRTPRGDAGADTGMETPMDGGMVMEEGVFNIHLGSTECQGDPGGGSAVTSCARPNVGEVSLAGFDPTKETVLVDYKALVAGADVTKDLGGAPGCMSGATDPECPSVLSRLGIDPTTGQPDATQQALFRVR